MSTATPAPGGSDWLVVDALAPATSGSLAPLYEAAAEGRLAMPFCAGCGLVLELEQLVCDRCASRVQEWQTVEPRGTVHAVTVVHRLQAGLVRTDQPYPLVDVELASGHRVLMTTVARADRPPAIGDPVSVTFRTIGTVAVPALAVDRPPQSSAAGTAATDTEVSP